MTAKQSDLLRRHLIEHHGMPAAYFEEPHMRNITLENLRWLHAPYLKTREYPEGCPRDIPDAENRPSTLTGHQKAER